MLLLTKLHKFCSNKRLYSTLRQILPKSSTKLNLDLDYLCDKKSYEEIQQNIKIRKGAGSIEKVIELYENIKQEQKIGNLQNVEALASKLLEEAKRIPNKTHPKVKEYRNEPNIIKHINKVPEFEHKPYDFSEITKKLIIMRSDKLGDVCGNRSYYFMSDLAELEEALIKYTVRYLLNQGFQLVSVPDILPYHIIESCGMIVDSDRTQIYSLDASHHGPELCLSGTAEMSLAGLLMNTKHKEESLPLKLAAVSRCYRAEISNLLEEKGIYRVHQFTKVEMFGVTTPSHSDQMLEEFRTLEEKLFSDLDLHMRVLDMPPHELGAPAYRKYDIEAWMPGRNMFGEISSCSNCTDYQSRRLDIKYTPNDSSLPLHTHTLNGTACAVPRMLIAIMETHQLADKILIPKPLRKYMSNKEYIVRKVSIPQLKLSKVK